MTSIVKLSIVCDHDSTDRVEPGSEVAYMYPGEDEEWRDPFGGVFTDAEQEGLQRVACGTGRSVDFSLGTKWERRTWCRLVATFI
jgi:hypothetical protein